ncbi:MAG TPA: hypothetical protein VKU90_10315 [Caulobacteraceae bacterium]|nr:hypothetical protein [Caulobacteraceae bacterium]
MLFRQAILAKVRAGEVSVAFRRWTKPSVKTGGFQVTSIGRLAIDEVRPVREADITDADARRAGEASRADLMAALAKGGGELFRIAFHLEGADPRIALREDDQLSAADRATLHKRLARMDASAPWTTLVMDLIAAHPGRRAGDLAPMAGLERLEFKARVRRLKALGLTISLETGYRLSPRGEALRRLDRASGPLIRGPGEGEGGVG